MASISIKFTIHDIISDLSCPFDVWFLDDGTIGGSLDQTLNNIGSIQQSSSEICLSVNSDKCEITVLSAPSLPAHRRTICIVKARQLLPGLIDVFVSSLTLLGASLRDPGVHLVLHWNCQSHLQASIYHGRSLGTFFLSRYVWPLELITCYVHHFCTPIEFPFKSSTALPLLPFRED